MLQALLALVVLCAAPVVPIWGQPVSLTTTYTGANATERRSDGGASALVQAGEGKIQLKLCECERATGAPNGLSCGKQGWFITSFERQGQWVAGGGLVPLSHAICCRPCLPDELPPDPSGRVPGGQKPLGVLSLGCHSSTDELPVRCEGSGRSFASGFSESVRVFTAADTYYPINTINCCTPSLLLENGDAWELERCDCHDSHNPTYPVNCGGLDTDELLFGYIFYRLSPLGHVVPVGPAQCCKVCLSPTLHPMDQCDDLSQCSRNGVCHLGACDCFEGWAGADCSRYVGRGGGGGGGGGHGIPPWAITLIVLSSCALAGVFLVAAGHIIRLVQEGDGEGGSEAGEERQPLILRIDADDAGSVGSQDTECLEDELEEVQERVNTVIARLEERSPGISGYHPPTVVEGGTGPATPNAQASPRAHGAGAADLATALSAEWEGGGSAGAGQPGPNAAAAGTAGAAAQREGGGEGVGAEAPAPRQGLELVMAVAAEPAPPRLSDTARREVTAAGVAAAAGAGGQGEGGKEEVEEGEEGGLFPPRARREPDPLCPLSVVDCLVCMSRPVQVVLVPCGHVCMCRRCSRKINRCPVCRKDILRRQKLFI